MALLQARDIAKSFGSRLILDGLDSTSSLASAWA